uniref:Uncharacterized protein n=1 Tax=Cannabis sativa TaxID=3483 RepID=A0A803QAD9_CANSA
MFPIGRIADNPFWLICGDKREDIEHLFFDCSYGKPLLIMFGGSEMRLYGIIKLLEFIVRFSEDGDGCSV